MRVRVRVRAAAVAGRFYPADPRALTELVDRLLADARPRAVEAPRALVAPHAGYLYSGPVAATAYATLTRGSVERVVLLGPAHFVWFDGVAVPSVDAFATPLGPVAIDRELRARALACPGVVVNDEPHAPEHALEVHLPFVLRALGTVSVLPLLVSSLDADVVADVLDAVARDDRTLIVCSSDLSHYHDDATAKARDRKTAGAIVARDPGRIGPGDACGRDAIRGLLARARRAELRVTLLDLRTSADTAGDPTSVVGYGAFALTA